jgi:hypothetical protein
VPAPEGIFLAKRSRMGGRGCARLKVAKGSSRRRDGEEGEGLWHGRMKGGGGEVGN